MRNAETRCKPTNEISACRHAVRNKSATHIPGQLNICVLREAFELRAAAVAAAGGAALCLLLSPLKSHIKRHRIATFIKQFDYPRWFNRDSIPLSSQ